MVLFYDETLDPSNLEFSYSREDSKHLVKVLRKKMGDQITITNGKGLEWRGELTHVSPNLTFAKKIDSQQHQTTGVQIHLAIAPTKNNNRMEWLIEKLTELGVVSIRPLICDHSERKIIKVQRLEKIAIAALKQSQQFYLPKIHPLNSFSDFIESEIPNGFIAHCDSSPKELLTNCILNQNEVTLLIGPEGDFSPREIKLAEEAGLRSVSIGQQRFRTETAGLLACHTVFLLNQKK